MCRGSPAHRGAVPSTLEGTQAHVWSGARPAKERRCRARLLAAHARWCERTQLTPATSILGRAPPTVLSPVRSRTGCRRTSLALPFAPSVNLSKMPQLSNGCQNASLSKRIPFEFLCHQIQTDRNAQFRQQFCQELT